MRRQLTPHDLSLSYPRNSNTMTKRMPDIANNAVVKDNVCFFINPPYGQATRVSSLRHPHYLQIQRLIQPFSDTRARGNIQKRTKAIIENQSVGLVNAQSKPRSAIR